MDHSMESHKYLKFFHGGINQCRLCKKMNSLNECISYMTVPLNEYTHFKHSYLPIFLKSGISAIRDKERHTKRG